MKIEAKACGEESDGRKVRIMPQTQPKRDPVSEALQEVLTHPDLDEPRHKYASLLETVDPRREFIEAQLTLAKRGFNPEDRESFMASLTSERLLEMHYDHWRPEWNAEANQLVQGYDFYRGFVELVQISGEGFLQAGEGLFAAAPIRHLNLVSTHGLWQRLSDFASFGTIVSLALDNNDLADSDLAWLAKSPYLKELRWMTLTNNRGITRSGVEVLAGHRENLPRLSYISLEGTRFNPVERIAADGDLITKKWLPEMGLELEKAYGDIPWLRTQAVSRTEVPPNRFALLQDSPRGQECNRSDQYSPSGVLAEAL